MSRTLEPYQVEAMHHLAPKPHAMLFAGCGLGKTAAALHAFLVRRAFFGGGPALVVAPLRVATLTWPAEVAAWGATRHLRIVDLRADPLGLTKDADLYVINWDRLDRLAEFIKRARRCPFDLAILDELSKAKSHKSKRMKHALACFEHYGVARWGLTGTPRPNSHLDLFAQARLVDGGKRLGRSFENFRRAHYDATDYMEYNWEPKPGCEARIESAIADITLVQRSSDYLRIPDTTVDNVEVVLPAKAMTAYHEMQATMVAKLETGEVEALGAAAVLNKLLQFSGGFSYDHERNVHHVHSAKLDALRAMLEAADEPLLIAANYRHELEAIAALPGVETWSDDILPRWNAKRVKALVAHPASIGHGLNLQHGGRRVVWFSLTWSRELYDQFNARLARKGQGEVTTVTHIMSDAPADWAVLATLENKGTGQSALMDAVHALKR